ncbi:hypothetical protein BLNAU_7635 [Blattamonas nauphoetae]|uniref:Uncharacterized protein n=1 Tax=Blattamonas nauphoetae TaxID=2049346 RepID=A0ABQ9Y157_9EUKA|nr:hypothetical protein BLNAU_7635 [Blattamonas nauphoetae]
MINDSALGSEFPPVPTISETKTGQTDEVVTNPQQEGDSLVSGVTSALDDALAENSRLRKELQALQEKQAKLLLALSSTRGKGQKPSPIQSQLQTDDNTESQEPSLHELKQTIQKLEGELKTVSAELSQKNVLLREVQRNEIQYREDNNQLRNNLSKLQTNLLEVTDAMKSTKRMNELLRQKDTDQQSRISSLNSELESANQKISAFKSQISEMKQLNRTEKGHIDEANQTISQLKAQLAIRDESNGQHENILSQLRQDLELTKSNLAKVKHENLSLSNRLGSITQQYASLQSSSLQKEFELQQEILQLQQRSDDQNDADPADIRRNEPDFAEDVVRLTNEIENKDEEIRKLREKIRDDERMQEKDKAMFSRDREEQIQSEVEKRVRMELEQLRLANDAVPSQTQLTEAKPNQIQSAQEESEPEKEAQSEESETKENNQKETIEIEQLKDTVQALQTQLIAANQTIADLQLKLVISVPHDTIFSSSALVPASSPPPSSGFISNDSPILSSDLGAAGGFADHLSNEVPLNVALPHTPPFSSPSRPTPPDTRFTPLNTSHQSQVPSTLQFYSAVFDDVSLHTPPSPSFRKADSDEIQDPVIQSHINELVSVRNALIAKLQREEKEKEELRKELETLQSDIRNVDQFKTQITQLQEILQEKETDRTFLLSERDEMRESFRTQLLQLSEQVEIQKKQIQLLKGVKTKPSFTAAHTAPGQDLPFAVPIAEHPSIPLPSTTDEEKKGQGKGWLFWKRG